MDFQGQKVLVTGGVSGIGHATAQAFAKAGAHVICVDLNAARGAEVVAEGRAAKQSFEFFPVDLGDTASTRACAEAVLKAHQRLDVIVNAAGMSNIQHFMENTPDYINKVLAVNLAGPIHLTQALLPPMIAANKGKIVNVASDAGRVGSSGETVYAAAKGGVMAFTKSLAREVARYSINVNCVCPGPTDTPMLRTRPEKMREAFVKAIALRRLGKPEEIADSIMFLASSRASYITGQLLSVSGGLTFPG